MAGKRLTCLTIACLILATIAVYLRVFGNGYVFDDTRYILENPHVQQGISLSSIKWAFTSTLCSNWHPLTWLSMMLDWVLFGMKPWGYHLTNLLIHIANTILLLLLLNRLTGSFWRSSFVAALFALHPLRVESVAWAAERKDVLSTFFAFTAIWAYVRYAEKPSFLRYSLVFLLFALGLMAKPMLVTLPIILLLMDYWPLRRFPVSQKPRTKHQAPSTKHQAPSTKHLVLEKIPLLILSAGSSFMTYFAQRQGGAVMDLARYSLGARLGNALVSYVRYIGKMFWPGGLAAYYPYNPIPTWEIAGACLILAAISIGVFKARKSRPYLAWGWLWYIITLIPVIGIVQVGGQSMADRYTYIPLIGLFVMIVWSIERLDKKTLAPIGALILGALMIGTWHQVGYWKSDLILFEHAAAVTKNNTVALCDVGLMLAREGKLKESFGQLSKALEIDPDCFDAHVNIANTLILMGRKDEALDHYRKALEIRPRNPKAMLGMANLLVAREGLDAAIARYEDILRAGPNDADTHYNLGLALHAKGEDEEAASHFRQAVEIRPRFAEAYFQLGSILAGQGYPDEAIAQFREAIGIKPDYADAYCSLGRALAGKGQIDEAVENCRKAVQLSPNSAMYHHNLGSALDAKGMTGEAIDEYRQAIRLQPNLAPSHNSLAVALYYQGKYAEAWREVHASERYGYNPAPGFLNALSERMPDPGP